MLTPLQTKLIHIAKKEANLNDAQYRMLLNNVAGVESSKLLSQSAYEDVMAVMELRGFRMAGQAENYWQRKMAMRGESNLRMSAKIHELVKESRYELAALCGRFSEHRADCPEKMLPAEQWNLIEMLKASSAREAAPTEMRNGAAKGPLLFELPAQVKREDVKREPVISGRGFGLDPVGDEDVPF